MVVTLLTVAVHDYFPPLVLIQEICSSDSVRDHLNVVRERVMKRSVFKAWKKSYAKTEWRDVAHDQKQRIS